jgi:hypothetical protein
MTLHPQRCEVCSKRGDYTPFGSDCPINGYDYTSGQIALITSLCGCASYSPRGGCCPGAESCDEYNKFEEEACLECQDRDTPCINESANIGLLSCEKCKKILSQGTEDKVRKAREEVLDNLKERFTYRQNEWKRMGEKMRFTEFDYILGVIECLRKRLTKKEDNETLGVGE